MESVILAFKQLWDKGLAYEGVRVLRTVGTTRRRCPTTNCAWTTTSIRAARTRPSPSAYASKGPGQSADRIAPAGVDHHAMDVAVQPGRRGQSRCHLRRGHRARRQPVCSRAGRLAAYARELGEEPEVRGDLFGCRAARHEVPAAVPVLHGFGERPQRQVLRGDFVTTEDGTGIVHMAPTTARTTRPPPIPSASCRPNRWTPKGRFDASVPDYQGQQVFEANPNIIRDLKNGTGPRRRTARCCCVTRPTSTYPHCWRCESADLPRGVLVVRQGDRIPGPHGRTQPADHLVPRTRQDGQFGKWLENARGLVDLAKPLLGQPHSGVEVRRSLSTDRRVRQSRRTRSVTSGSRPDNLHRPFIDQLTRPNPDDPTGTPRCAASEDIFDVWFDSGSMPFAQVHYPFENQEWFEHPFPRRFHRRVHRPDPRLVLHHARAGHRAVRPAGVQNPCGTRHRAGQ